MALHSSPFANHECAQHRIPVDDLPNHALCTSWPMQEKSYLEKKNKLGKSEIDDEITRLTGLSGKSMSPTQAAWISQRVQLLNKLKQEL
eukprot:scaffold282646_cov40-Tisochrysis_lutea.AAC.2